MRSEAYWFRRYCIKNTNKYSAPNSDKISLKRIYEMLLAKRTRRKKKDNPYLAIWIDKTHENLFIIIIIKIIFINKNQ